MNTNEERKRTTRLTRAVLSVISALMLFSLLVLFTFAADSTSPYDAQFGELYYENLSDAIEAANSSASGGTVTVLRDVNLSECLTISKNVTLTGKYTIYRADSYTETLFNVAAGVTLTLDGGITIDGGNEWTIDMDLLNACMAANGVGVETTQFVTAEAGAPKATVYAIKIYGNIVMNNATVKNHYTVNEYASVFYIAGGASLTMNSGATATHNCTDQNIALVHCALNGDWIINDGAEVSYNHSTEGNGGVAWITGRLTMNGGDVHHNTQTWGAGSFVMIHSSSAVAGNTVMTLNGGHIYENTDVSTSTGSGATIYCHANGTFNMNGGVIENNYSNASPTISGYQATSKLNLNGGIIRQGQSASDCPYESESRGALYIAPGMTIEEGRFRLRYASATIDGHLNCDLVLFSNARTITASGVIEGDVINSSTNMTLNGGTWNGDISVPANGTLKITSGTYNGSFNLASGAKLSITSGIFRTNPAAYLAAGSQSFYDAETGLYIVYSGNVASFGGAEYATLAEAIAAANAVGGGEVSLLRSTYVSEQIGVSSNITLTGDYIISRAKAPLENYTGTLFNVAAGATLTLDGGITIDGGNNWVLDEEKVKAEWHDDATSGTYVTPETDAPVATGHMFYVAGNVVLNDAIVQNQYSASYSAFQLVSPGVLTMNDGAKITHNCKMNNNVAVILPAGAEWIINEGAEVSHNFAKGNGGLVTTNGNLTMNGGEIHHNINHTGSGSFLMMYGAGNLTINDCYVHHNLAFGGGWGCTIYIHSGSTGTMTMNDGLFEDNFSSRTSTIVKGSNNSTLNLNGGTIVQEQTDGYYKDKVNMTDYKDGYAGYYSGDVYFGEDMTVTGWRTIFNANAENYGRIETDVYLAGATTTYSGSGTVTGDIYVSGANTAINGGVWEGEFIVADGAALSITGGLFKNDPSAYLADCYEAVYDEASGFYTVKKYYEASFGGVDYVTLEEAIAAANTAGGGTVTLLHDVDLDSSITLSSDILLEGAYSVVRSDSYTGNLFTVDADCTLTLDGVLPLTAATSGCLITTLFMLV
ncbi:MAG: hypothetical protein E7676_01815 [Ruminococcaceae bacterium]|nr:hypothetical protein [Oscillospiraceae bacterium]